MDTTKEHVSASGLFVMQVWRKGELIETYQDKNLIVDAGRTVFAHLLGGDVTGKSITEIAFGPNTGNTTPAPGDTLWSSPLLKPVTVSYPAAGQVRFDWSLGADEGNGLQIKEMGLVTYNGTLVSRKTRSAIEKTSDLSLTGYWIISF